MLWRIRAPLSFAAARISWHPQRFAAVYGDFVQSWRTGLGLSLLVFRLRDSRGLVLHGAASVLNGQGVLCAGISGVGKSTLARLLHAAGATVLTDERPVVRQGGVNSRAPGSPDMAEFRVHGSPWPSSGNFACPASAPLRRIYFLEHGAQNAVTPLAPREAFNRLLHVTTIPWQDATLFDPCLQTIDALLRSVPCAQLSFRPTPEVVDLIRQDLAARPPAALAHR